MSRGRNTRASGGPKAARQAKAHAGQAGRSHGQHGLPRQARAESPGRCTRPRVGTPALTAMAASLSSDEPSAAATMRRSSARRPWKRSRTRRFRRSENGESQGREMSASRAPRPRQSGPAEGQTVSARRKGPQHARPAPPVARVHSPPASRRRARARAPSRPRNLPSSPWPRRAPLTFNFQRGGSTVL